MFELLNPQPLADDKVLDWPKYEQGGRFGITNDGLFIPYPDEDMTGVKIIKYDGLWYWARPQFYNKTNPHQEVANSLISLNALYSPQLDLIANCLSYADNNPSSTLTDHYQMVLVAAMYELLTSALAHLNPEQREDVSKRFEEWELSHL